MQQQYRPRSPAGATIHGNATSSYVPAGSAAGAGHMEPVNQGSGACGMCNLAAVISLVHLCILSARRA